MKNLIFIALISFFLFPSCVKKNDADLESIQDASTDLQFTPEVLDFISNLQSPHESPFWVALYSEHFDEISWYAMLPIPNTQMEIVLKYPTQGDETSLMYTDELLTNLTDEDPAILIVDFITASPKVIYSNWCEDEKAGFSNLKSDGGTLGLDTSIDSHPILCVMESDDEKTDLTAIGKTRLREGFPALGNCEEESTKVDVSWNVEVSDGRWSTKISLGEETFSN